MAFMPFVAFLLWFFLFAASSGLTYLSLRSWLHFLKEEGGNRFWREDHRAHLLRSVGFACLTLAALVGAVSDTGEGLRRFDIVSLTRILGDVLLLVSTPRRLRRQRVVGLSFILLLLGESLILLHASGTLPLEIAVLLVPGATVVMDIGIGLLWNRYTRTVLRVRLTDKFTLAFAVFSLFLMLVVTLSVVVVIQSSLLETLGLSGQDILPAFQSLNRTIILLFVSMVAVSAIVSFFLARSMIAPVNRMGFALRAIGKGEWDRRLRGIRTRDEIQDLAQEINEMAHRLKEADAVRAEFVSFASHELRNPLTAVKGFVETLHMIDSAGQEMTIEERVEIYKIVSSECERLLRMTDELLDASRVETGRPVLLDHQTFDLVRQCEKVVRIMQTHTDKHTLSIVSLEQPVSIEADPDKLEQILINLLSNAIKYSPQGGEIVLTVKNLGSVIELLVRDEGLGMTPEQAEHVFDKYYRIQEGARSSAGRKPATGTGIGLYLTRALVNAHGGTIRVESEPGGGSTFFVTMPRKQPVPAPEPTPMPKMHEPSDAERMTASTRV